MGCAAPIGPESDAGSTTQKISVVEVRAWHAPSDGALIRLDAAARFVSVREPGAPSDALDLLGLGWATVPAGTCTLPSSEPAPSANPVRVDLRDLSPVKLLVGREQIDLEPRAFPDVAGLVSGVVFVAPSELAAPAFAKSISLQVGQGQPAITALELPELPAPLRLVDAVANEGATFSVDARGLDIATAAPSLGDRIAVEVVRAGVVRARCSVDTNGKLHIDSAALGGTGDATLVVRAQRRVLRDDAVNALDARLERDVEVRLVIR